MKEREEEMRDAERVAARETEVTEFEKVTANLHHLLSTASQPGIYNGPYQSVPATAMGLPVEVHLRAGVKDLLRTRMRKKTPMVRDMNGTYTIPTIPRDTRSIQATGRYGEGEEGERAERSAGKRRWVGEGTFRGGGVVPEPAYSAGINVGVPFVDMYNDPFAGTRLEAGKKPFYTTVGGNKSRVKDGGVFDVMGEVEERGQERGWGEPETGGRN